MSWSRIQRVSSLNGERGMVGIDVGGKRSHQLAIRSKILKFYLNNGAQEVVRKPLALDSA